MLCNNCKRIVKKRIEWFIENTAENINKAGAIMLIKETFENIIKKKD